MEITNAPFVGTEAIAAGLVTKRTLHSRHQMVYRNIYLRNGIELTPKTRAVAAWLWSGRSATVGGLSAAALHGMKWIDPRLPAELFRGEAASNGIIIHRSVLDGAEVCQRNGMSITTPARTAFDLGRRQGLEDGLIRLDALANATGLTPHDVSAVASKHPGARGARQLLRLVEIMDGGAESPPETRTRLVLLRAGLRRPQTQIAVYDGGGYPFAVVDMSWPDLKVGVEYDGIQHWTDPKQRAHDIDRMVELTEHGWVIIRVSADMLRYRPRVIVDRTVDALRAAGCTWLAECGLNSRRLGAVSSGRCNSWRF